MDREKLIS